MTAGIEVGTTRHFSLLVIGGGPGGYVAAIRSAQLGMKTALIERNSLGGRCLNEACIPAKVVLRSADLWQEVHGLGQFGIEVDAPSLSYSAVARRRDRVIKTMTGGVKGLLGRAGVETIHGHASFTSAKAVTVQTDVDRYEVTADAIVVATGSVAVAPKGVEFGGRIRDTAATWLADRLPERLAVLGAGPSGVEAASAFGRLGCEVHLFEMADSVLPGEDSEVSQGLRRALEKQCKTVNTGTRIQRVTQDDRAVILEWAEGRVETDFLCVAGGRKPDLEGLGLDRAGVTRDAAGRITVNDHLQTSADGIYAIGDAVPGPMLAHKASEEGIVAVETAAGNDVTPLDYDFIPRVAFCSPQVASFGLTEARAVERLSDEDVIVGRFPYAGIGAATVYGDRNGFVKLIADKETGEILGTHILGIRAGDLLAELVMARHAEATVHDIVGAIHAHPTLSEGVIEAARDALGQAIHK